jgi:hypothetical protein
MECWIQGFPKDFRIIIRRSGNHGMLRKAQGGFVNSLMHLHLLGEALQISRLHLGSEERNVDIGQPLVSRLCIVIMV